MKTFTLSGTEAVLPMEWLQAVGAPNHVRQGEMLMTALKKTDIPALLTDRGIGQAVADRLGKSLRLQTRGLSRGWDMMVTAGIIDLDEVAVYAAHNMVRESIVVRIGLDGTAVPVARFDYQSSTGLTVEAI